MTLTNIGRLPTLKVCFWPIFLSLITDFLNLIVYSSICSAFKIVQSSYSLNWIYSLLTSAPSQFFRCQVVAKYLVEMFKHKTNSQNLLWVWSLSLIDHMQPITYYCLCCPHRCSESDKGVHLPAPNFTFSHLQACKWFFKTIWLGFSAHKDFINKVLVVW